MRHCYRRILPILSASLLCTVGGVPQAAATDLGQTEQSIVNGELEDGFPATVAVGAEFGGNRFSACTASVITPRMLLSAAHCGADLPIEVVVSLGSAFLGPDVQTADRLVGFTDLFVHPEYVPLESGFGGNLPEFDVGVLVLEEDVDIEPFWLRSEALTNDEVGAEVYSIGYGATSGEGGGSGVRRSALLTVDSINDQFVISDSDSNAAGANICSGDSGGPQVHDDDGLWVQWGVHSWGDQNCLASSGSTRVDLVYEWIMDQVEAVHGTRDLCDAQGRYGDGVCDEFCDEVDPDCIPPEDPEVPEESGCSGCSSRPGSEPAGSAFLLALVFGWGLRRKSLR